MISGSIDKSLKLFNFDKDHGRYIFEKELAYHDEYVYSVTAAVNNTGFFSGSKDRKIFKLDVHGNPLMEYLGHEGVVNSLHQVNPHELVSGSWDGTAKIWDVETGVVKYDLPGHAHATTVLQTETGLVVTGSQDKTIRIW